MEIDNKNLEILKIQYLADVRYFYTSPMHCTREELARKPILSKEIKETIKEMKSCFENIEYFNYWYENTLAPEREAVLKFDDEYFKKFKLN